MKNATAKTRASTKDQVILHKAARGVLLKSVPYFAPTKLDDVAGMLKYDGPPISLEDMNVAIFTEARRRAGD